MTWTDPSGQPLYVTVSTDPPTPADHQAGDQPAPAAPFLPDPGAQQPAAPVAETAPAAAGNDTAAVDQPAAPQPANVDQAAAAAPVQPANEPDQPAWNPAIGINAGEGDQYPAPTWAKPNAAGTPQTPAQDVTAPLEPPAGTSDPAA